jgi:hypothetical protein
VELAVIAPVTGARLAIIRVASLFLLPAGLVCIGFPFYSLTLPGGWAIIDDTRAAFGAGTDAGALKAASVDCTRQRSGSNSSRGVGLTQYDCVIDLGSVEEASKVDPWAGRSWDEGYKEYNRQLAAQMAALLERSRSGASNRLERALAADRSGQLPAVRLLSGKDEPRRIGLVWGFGEIAGRWLSWLASNLIVLAFGAGCLFAVRLAWKRQPRP